MERRLGRSFNSIVKGWRNFHGFAGDVTCVELRQRHCSYQIRGIGAWKSSVFGLLKVTTFVVSNILASKTGVICKRRIWHPVYKSQKKTLLRYYQVYGGDEPEKEDLEARNVFEIGQGTSTRLSWRVDQVRDKPVLPVLLGWIAEGNKLQRTDITNTITILKNQGRYLQALEVSEWLLQEKPFQVVEPDYAFWLYFTGKVHGQQKAQEALLQIPTKFQREKAYESLLKIVCDDKNIPDVICLLKKMKELNIPIRVFCYNHLILLYHQKERENEIPLLLDKMKNDGVACNIDTYNILIMIMSKKYDFSGMERVFRAMQVDSNVKPDHVTYMMLASAYLEAGHLEKAEAAVKEVERKYIRGTRRKTIDQLMLMYAYLGKVKDVEWAHKHSRKVFAHTALNTFISAIEAYGEIGRVDLAEQAVEEMVHERGWHHVKQFNAILGAYVRNGLIEKAEEVLKQLHASSCLPNAITSNYLLLGYLKAGQLNKAVEIMNAARTVGVTNAITQTKPWLRTTLGIIDLLAENGDVEHAELFFQNLEAAKLSHYPKAYNMLLKAYVKVKRPIDGFLVRMSLHHATPDAETYMLLKQLDELGSLHNSSAE